MFSTITKCQQESEKRRINGCKESDLPEDSRGQMCLRMEVLGLWSIALMVQGAQRQKSGAHIPSFLCWVSGRVPRCLGF